jgi:hypothetical protein
VIRPTSMLAEALALARHGWAIFPQRPNKSPYIVDWPSRATTDEGQLRAWWSSWPWASPATVIGAGTVGSAFVVLDADVRHGASVRVEHLPATLVAESGSDPPGFHAWFRRPAIDLHQHSPEPQWRGCELLGVGGPRAVT